MQSTAVRKRPISTCVPCYTRKQKCDRQFPCNHCRRRRRPEECVFEAKTPRGNQQPTVSHALAAPVSLATAINDGPFQLELGPPGHLPSPQSQQHESGDRLWNPRGGNPHADLAKSFGYFEDSSCNTMALLKTVWDLDARNRADNGNDEASSLTIADSMHRDVERMPQRQILDFLIQYFVSEVNWIKQFVHAPSFLDQYQEWWAKERPLSVADVEFGVLVLRICSYAAEFLPSPSCTVDKISGMTLTEIRDTCSQVGDSLAKACFMLDWKGSLVRVQHTLFASLKFSCNARTDKFWEGIAYATQAAQKVGLHTDANNKSLNDGVYTELEKEMRRRTFCNLYILDSHLSRQLDRVPFLPDDSITETLPSLRFLSSVSESAADTGAPEIYTERIMQLRLGKFWRRVAPKRGAAYDPAQGEQRYEQFCHDFLPILPPALALEPDTSWDKNAPKLAMQRHLLHISVYDSICWNYRPLLLLNHAHVAALPPYKQVLLQFQREKMAMAAMKELESISKLHAMLGGAHTRFAAIIFNTFEAAVLLVCLCTSGHLPLELKPGHEEAELLGLTVSKVTQGKALAAAEVALRRLEMLAQISDMAALGAQVVGQLLTRAAADSTSQQGLKTPVSINTGSSWSSSSFTTLLGTEENAPGPWNTLEQPSQTWMSEFFSTLSQQDERFAEPASFHFDMP